MLVEAFLTERSDRLVALGRMAIAVFALVAIWLDPSQPAVASELAYGLLMAYNVFAVAVLLLSSGGRELAPPVVLAAHIVDVAVYSALMFLTEGPTSPFFLLFTFSLVTATYRWHWRGALWTTATVLILLIILAATQPFLGSALPFETDRFLIRCAQVLVVGALLVYFGFRYQQLAEKALQLASWSPDPSLTAPVALLEECLLHVQRVFAAPFSALVLTERSLESTTLAVLDAGRFRHERIADDAIDRIAPDAVEPGHVRPACFVGAGGDGQVPGASRERFGHGERALSVPVLGEETTGRLYVAGRADLRPEDLPLAAVIASQVGVAIDRVRVMERSRRAAAAEERLRLARDLHDGLLQTLAGTAMHLEKLRRDARGNPELIQSTIDRLQTLLLSEQRQVRAVLGSLRTEPGVLAADGPWLRETLTELELQWNVRILLSAEAGTVPPPELAFEIRHILREAVANAARHGNASLLRIEIGRSEEGLRLEIADDGQGFPEQGGRDRPRSLRERVEALGGALASASAKGAGVTLSISLPIAREFAG